MTDPTTDPADTITDPTRPAAHERAASVFTAGSKRIRPDDIRAKFDELSDEVEEIGNEVRSVAVTAVAVGVVVVVAVAFWLGRRRGRRGATVLEITRR